MAKKVILGTDIARDAFKTKVNDNFTELYDAVANIDVSDEINAHNTDNSSHQDIRQQINSLDADVIAHKAGSATHVKPARFVVGTSTSGWTEKDCDYLCDGTADQVEINNAITALPATGGEIVILDGTYNITATIDVTKDNVSIKGNGNATILKRGWNATGSPSSVNSPIIFCGRNNCLISNLAIDGNKGIYTASSNTNISIEGSNNILTNISANNCASNSVRVSGDFNKITCNKVIGNSNNSGIYLAGDFNIVFGNECRDNFYQINLNGANNNIITSNICIRGTGLPSDYGSSYGTINLFESTNNYNLIAMNNCMGKAVTIGGGTGNTLVNNKFDAT